MFRIILFLLLLILLNISSSLAQKFGVIGDFGNDSSHELDVANMIKNSNPDFIVTVGDNNYEDGEASTIDQNIGKYFADWIFPYSGSFGDDTATTNRFFPVPGNHDWDSQSDLDPYLDYFTLPHNEYYYDFVWGDVHFFMIDSDPRTADGINSTSTQALWIKSKMQNSTAKWKIAVLHRPPYNSTGGDYSELRWPFKSWGADAVFAGHKHNYERLEVGGLLYFVNGLGGKSRQSFESTVSGSQFRYNSDYGAMIVEATSSSISFSFYNTSGTQIDLHEITDPTPVELAYFSGAINGDGIELRWRTETEVNNYGFDIERTSNKSDWLTIGFQEGHGNSNSPKQYHFTDDEINQSGTYFYRLKQVDNDGTYEYSNVVNIEVDVPNNFYLSQNYPNPFNPETIIEYTLPEQQIVSLRVYNILGEMVKELVNEVKPAGTYTAIFDGSDIPSGVYVYRIQTKGFAENKKMTLLK